MDKDSRYQLQKLDCNCNNCGYMVRDFEKYEASLVFHHKMQLDYFTAVKQKTIDAAKYWDETGEKNKAELLWAEARSMKFQFNKKEAIIQYGHCHKFNKPVSFIPDTCQLDTQECFIHRRVWSELIHEH